MRASGAGWLTPALHHRGTSTLSSACDREHVRTSPFSGALAIGLYGHGDSPVTCAAGVGAPPGAPKGREPGCFPQLLWAE